MPTKTCRSHMSVWILVSVIAVVTAKRQPPMITKFSPKDLINPDEVKYRKSNGFSLPCEALGSNLTWTWEHNGEPITAFYGYPFSLSQDGTLTGNYLRAEHSGTYQCFVKDEVTGITVFSRKLQVAVTVVGDFIDRRNVVKKVDLGQPFSFQCPDHKPSFGTVYTWVGRKRIQFSRSKRRGISPNGSLYIVYLTQEDIDEIRERNGIKCKISGANSYRESGALKLEKNDEEQSDPGKLFPPSWATKPEAEELALEGRSKSLYCLATGRPVPSITWRKNGKRIVHGRNSFEIPASFQGRRVVIKSVSRARHQDQYTCEAENVESNGRPLIHTIELVVEVAPRWSVKPPPRKMNIVIGKNGTLECRVTAVPPANVTWYKDGIQLESSHEHLKMYGDKLEFKDAVENSDGVYQCTAENRHGMIASATWIHVQAWKPTFSDIQFGPFHLLHGSQGRLQCNPSAAPLPTFQWFTNGVLIFYGGNSRYELEQDGTLVIKKVDRELDAVNFTCRAENYLGADSASSIAAVFVRPSFLVKPSDKIVMEKETVTFHCNASGSPTPNITWVKDGLTLSTGDTLSFRAQKVLSGKYWCVVDNGLGVTLKAEADLDVQFAPSFITKPSDQTVTENETVVFNCAATGNPTPQITWIKDGITVGTANNLTFAASKNDSGKYWCSASNRLGDVKQSADLDVQYNPENTQLTVNAANTSSVPFGSKITFACTSNSHPVVHEYRFYRFQELLGYSRTGFFSFNINKTGLHSCIPFNVVGSGEKAAVTIVVDDRPRFQVKPIDKVVLENERVTFRCIASGNPTPNITWVKGGLIVSTGDTLRLTAERNLSGKYWCLANNGLGITIKAEANLVVQFAPSLAIKPRDQTVTENETVVFSCAATGNPIPQITWIKDGITVGTANNLTFAASRSDSGKYWCSANNSLGDVKQSADLDVQYKPENTQLEVNAANTNSIPFGSNVTFTCTSNSHPVVHTYRFYRFQELLGYSRTGIFHLNINKTGLYSCIPFNVVGSGERATKRVVVNGVPSPPKNLQIHLDCNEWTVQLSWIAGASNGAPIDYYLIEEESSSHPWVFTFLYNVTDPYKIQTSLKLSGKSLPRLRMKAVNKFGASRPSAPTAEGTCLTPSPGGVSNCPVSLPQQSTGNCKILRRKELEVQRGIYQLAPRSPLPMPLVNMTISRLVAHLSQDEFEKEHFDSFSGMVIKNIGFAAQWREEHPEEITDFQEYENMFKEFRNNFASKGSSGYNRFVSDTERFSDLLKDWRDDDIFAEQRLSGGNPMVLRRVTGDFSDVGLKWSGLSKTLNPNFNWEAAIQAASGNSDKLEEAIRRGNVYVLRYEVFDDMVSFPDTEYQNPGRTLWPTKSPVALFVITSEEEEKRLRPAAIQIDYKPDSPVFSPVDGGSWMLAKMVVQATDYAHSQIVEHLLKIHLFAEPFCVVLNRQLSNKHPLNELLKYHCRGLLATNTIWFPSLTNPNGYMDQLTAMGYRGTVSLLDRSYKTLSWKDADFHLDIKNRGLDDKKLLPYFPYRDDSELLLLTITRMVEDYVGTYYTLNRHVKEDKELQAFVNELSAEGTGLDGGRGQIKDFPAALNTRSEVVDIVTKLLWLLSVKHAAVNYPVSDYGAFTPLMPTKIYNDTRVPPGEFSIFNLPNGNISSTQIEVAMTIGTYRYDTLFDYYGKLSNPLASRKVGFYYYYLKYAISPRLKYRNYKRFRSGHLTYPYLQHHWLPNGIQA